MNVCRYSESIISRVNKQALAVSAEAGKAQPS